MPLRVDLDQVRALFDRLPAAMPDDAGDLLRQSPALTASTLWPLLARRNVKRLLLTLRAATTASGDAATDDAASRILAGVFGLTDERICRLVTQPEVTYWLVEAERDPAAAVELLPHLGVAVVAEVAAAQGTCGPLPVAGIGARTVRFREHGIEYSAPEPLSGPVFAEVHEGALLLRTVTGDVDLTGETPGVRRIPEVGAGVRVASLPYAWRDDLVDDAGAAFWPVITDHSEQAELIRAGSDLIRVHDPDAWAELVVMLRWVVPLRIRDAFNIPGLRGLVACAVESPHRVALDLVHECSHSKLSTILELADVARNPIDPVYSPFQRERGPATSLIHSCWSFARELPLLYRLRDAGYVPDERRFVAEERKFFKFFELALPTIHAEIELTPFGADLVRSLERAIDELRVQSGRAA